MACLVGGCVRDLLLGRSPKDFDIATNATPNEIKRLFRNCRLVGRRFRLAHLYFQDEIIEVSTFRAAVPDNSDLEEETEDERGDGRPIVEGDISRAMDGMVLRDNSLRNTRKRMPSVGISPSTPSLQYFRFFECLTNHRSERPGTAYLTPHRRPVVRFTKDPVRMVRAVRLPPLMVSPSSRLPGRALCALARPFTRAAPARLYEGF
jgi:poly(A) polymerase